MVRGLAQIDADNRPVFAKIFLHLVFVLTLYPRKHMFLSLKSKYCIHKNRLVDIHVTCFPDKYKLIYLLASGQKKKQKKKKHTHKKKNKNKNISFLCNNMHLRNVVYSVNDLITV